ncbi:DoxX family protein [Nocardioides sp. T5]|uniref:DoxX family protein n=1 Tax=Nocardioides sp. T5 TaxID=3400182 RepID=UPI003A85F4B6
MNHHRVRALAHLLTGSTYVLLGYDAFRAPGGRVGLAAPTLAAMRRVAPIPEDDELVVRGNAAVQVLAGAALALSIAPQPAAIALVGSLVPTTVAGHGFWAIEDPADRKVQKVQFIKNMALVGGLLAIAASAGGRSARRRST